MVIRDRRCALEGRRTAAMMDVNRPLDSTDSTIDCSNDGCEPPPQELSSEYFFHAGVNVTGWRGGTGVAAGAAESLCKQDHAWMRKSGGRGKKKRKGEGERQTGEDEGEEWRKEEREGEGGRER